MAKFMFVYRNSEEAEREEMSPEQMQQVLQHWMNWIQGGMEAGWMIDGGDALLPVGKVVRADGTITDGPFVESKELVGGFSIVQADSVEEAAKLTENCPIFVAGGNVEVRQLMNTGDM
ncbi:MAG: YciI family protein [Planctomycetaceae bacterium]